MAISDLSRALRLPEMGLDLPCRTADFHDGAFSFAGVTLNFFVQ